MFSKKVFKPKCIKWIKENGWTDYSDNIGFYIHNLKLEEFPYKPQYLVSKDRIPFFLQFFQKGDWSRAKKLEFEGTGIDYYKYKFLLALQQITRIQVGLIMHNEQKNKFVFRQLDQLPKPVLFWKGMGCRTHELRHYELEYNCYKCFKERPDITHECLHQHQRFFKRKRREMAMWPITCFANEFIIQPKML